MEPQQLLLAASVIHRAGALGIRVSADGQDLICRPASALTDELRDQLRVHKPQILELLRAARTYTCSSCGQFRFDLPTVCYWCRE
jgi:hypothetical protein